MTPTTTYEADFWYENPNRKGLRHFEADILKHPSSLEALVEIFNYRFISAYQFNQFITQVA